MIPGIALISQTYHQVLSGFFYFDQGNSLSVEHVPSMILFLASDACNVQVQNAWTTLLFSCSGSNHVPFVCGNENASFRSQHNYTKTYFQDEAIKAEIERHEEEFNFVFFWKIYRYFRLEILFIKVSRVLILW